MNFCNFLPIAIFELLGHHFKFLIPTAWGLIFKKLSELLFLDQLYFFHCSMHSCVCRIFFVLELEKLRGHSLTNLRELSKTFVRKKTFGKQIVLFIQRKMHDFK